MDSLKGDLSTYYIGKFLNGLPEEDQLLKMKDDSSFKKIVLSQENIGLSALDLELKADRVVSNVFVSFLLFISAIIILLIVRKRITGERKQIGVLKALGYRPVTIASAYLVYPIIISLIGSGIGCVLGYFLYPQLLGFYRGYFNLPFQMDSMNYYYVILAFIIPLVVLALLTFITCLWMIRKKPLALLSDGEQLKINYLNHLVNRILKPLPFKSRFKYSLAFRSIGKLLAVAVAMFSTGLLITFSFIVLTMFDKAIDDTFKGSRFNYEVTFNQKVTEEQVPLASDDESLTKTMVRPTALISGDEITPIVVPPIDSETKKTVVTGIQPEGQLLVLENSKGEHLNGYLEEGLIINEMYQMLYDIKIGDQLKFIVTVDGAEKEVILPIKGVNASFNGPIIYYNQQGVNRWLGYSENAFNGMYTLTKPASAEDIYIGSIFSIDDLKENMQQFMEIIQKIMFVFVILGSIIAIAILIIISNLIIEENKKIISLLKVLGYREKEVSSILLNIYTPLVILAYGLSVVAGLALMKGLLNYLAKVMSVAFPVSMSGWQMLIGLAILLTVYFGCLFISRRSLRRISLSEALKQE